jgi:ABC-type dipeptide/oligopeptide/nickel transport system permease component
LTCIPSTLTLSAISRSELEEPVNSINWPRVVASGALWMVTYNLLWGVAWFAFMRREWQEAVDAIQRRMPWTAEVWFLWVVTTLPIGVAIMAYAASSTRSATKSALYAALPLWVLMTLGMVVWGRQESFSARILTIDSIVNLVAMVAAALAGGWSQYEA